MSGIGAVRSALRRPPRRWWTVLRTVLLAAAVEIGLRWGSLPWIARTLGVPVSGPDQPATDEAFAALTPGERDDVATVRRVLAARPFNGTCLRQALLVGHALRARRPVLRLGVRKTGGTVRAHAWVQIGNHAIDEYRLLPAFRTDFHTLDLSVTRPVGEAAPR